MRKVNLSKALVIMVASIITPIMVACGSADNSTTVPESSTEVQEENEIVSESIEVEPEEEEVQTVSLEPSDEEVIVIAEDGFQAIKELNPKEMIKRTDIELLYYMGQTEKADDETILEAITTLVNEKTEDYNSLGAVGNYVAMENVEFNDVQPISEEELVELNDVVSDGDMAMLKEIQNYQYRIEEAYKVQMSYDGMDEGQESYMLVVCANGQWKLDVCIATMWDMYRMMMEMK